ncbi:MAG: TRAP transporter substrate-binding protein [Proteobacteria bacterium]|nr:TRAP transporter substrate-binding protein [Pseudomonadota bacterium]
MSEIEISLGGYQPPSSVHNRAAVVFGDELRARLGDRIDYKLDGNMPESTGILAIDLLDKVESGDLTMCYFASSYLAERVPEVAIFDLPFVVESREKAYAALDGELGTLLKKRFLENTGFRVLAFFDNGFRHFSNGVKPIRTPADCQGLKLRTMNSELHQEVFKKLGFETKFVDVADLVEAAKSGEIDAQENPLTNTYRFGTHHYHRHITLSGHFFGMALFLCHNETFESWPEDVQQAVTEAAAVASKAQREFAGAEDEEVLASLKPEENDVVHLTDDEVAQFRDAVAPILEKHQQKLGADIFALVR